MTVLFAVPFQSEPETHPVSSTKYTGCFQEVKQKGRGAESAVPSRAQIENLLEQIFPLLFFSCTPIS